MAEFPDLGRHCAVSTCNLLDFLPFKCYGCQNVYCLDHFRHELHHCGMKDQKVPVCPLCNKPVPVGKNEDPNLVVGDHIDRECKIDPSRQKKAYKNVCTVRGCKRKEIVPITCSDCHQNFCISHRHGSDHECKPSKRIDYPSSPSYNTYDMDRALAEQLQRQEEGYLRQNTRPQQSERCSIS